MRMGLIHIDNMVTKVGRSQTIDNFPHESHIVKYISLANTHPFELVEHILNVRTVGFSEDQTHDTVLQALQTSEVL